jgi:ankyrin repeat protein
MNARSFDLGSADQSGRTAAWLAADQGHCALLTTLIARGAAVDAPDRDGQTPLMRSVLAGAPDCVARAIEAGADINRQTRNGNTALMLAAESRPGIVMLLLAAGADYEIRNGSSYTALMLAASEGCVECVDALSAVRERLHVENPLNRLARFLQGRIGPINCSMFRHLLIP